MCVMQLFDIQNQVVGYFFEQYKIVFYKGFYRYLVIGFEWVNIVDEIF